MEKYIIVIILSLIVSCSASYRGPYLFWGHEKVVNLQPRALVEASKEDFQHLYKEAKAILIFVRNDTNRLEGANYSKLQKLMQTNVWSYLPQHKLIAEPYNCNANIDIINLNGPASDDDSEIIAGYNDAVQIYGNGEVLAILANRSPDTVAAAAASFNSDDEDVDEHVIAKREANKDNDEGTRATTASPSSSSSTTTDETDKNFIYVADGRKAILYTNSAPVLKFSTDKEPIKLVEHRKEITFDDQKSKGYGRLNIIYMVDGEKLFVRFNFSMNYNTWSMKSVEVETKDNKTTLPIVGHAYNVPSAPVGFSFRCSSRQMLFRNGEDYLSITDYQIQPWLNGSPKFGDVYDCVGFVTSPILAGILVTLFLCSILAIGLLMVLNIKTPNRFECSRSKQLTFTIQE